MVRELHSNPVRSSAAATPSFSLRLTAYVAVLLVIALSVFTASPELHARLHAGHALKASTSETGGSHPADHNQQGPAADDDGCAIVLFGQGLLLAIVALCLSFWNRRVAAIVRPLRSLGVFATPRYWLPPLCGPPLS
jgi:hypothetical protein